MNQTTRKPELNTDYRDYLTSRATGLNTAATFGEADQLVCEWALKTIEQLEAHAAEIGSQNSAIYQALTDQNPMHSGFCRAIIRRVQLTVFRRFTDPTRSRRELVTEAIRLTRYMHQSGDEPADRARFQKWMNEENEADESDGISRIFPAAPTADSKQDQPRKPAATVN